MMVVVVWVDEADEKARARATLYFQSSDESRSSAERVAEEGIFHTGFQTRFPPAGKRGHGEIK